MGTAHIFSAIESLDEEYCDLWERVCNLRKRPDLSVKPFVSVRMKTYSDPICTATKPGILPEVPYGAE